jgi:hypothetical protein
MSEHLKRNLLLGLALAAVIAGVIIAAAPGGGHHTRLASRGLAAGSSKPSDVQLAAGYLGLSPAALRRRLRSGETMAEVAAATPGRSASGLIARLLAAREAALKAEKPLTSAGRQTLSRARSQIVAEANHGRGRSGPVQAAARYVGLSETALRDKLRSGQSLAQVAVGQSKSRAGLVEALVTLKAARLRTALAEGAITGGEEKAALASLASRVSQEVDAHIVTSAG